MAGTLYRVKSDNFWAAASVGAPNQWLHVDAGTVGRLMINPVKDANGNVAKPLILQSITVNNSSGSSSVFALSDSGRGLIAVLKQSVSEKDYHYNIPLRGSLVIDTAGFDVTVVYIRD